MQRTEMNGGAEGGEPASASPGGESAEGAEAAGALLEDPMAILAVLLAVLALLFTAARHPRFARVFRVVPLLVFAYFVPTLLSNTGVIPLESTLYDFVKTWLLPSSLLLLTLSVDIPAILRLGPNVLLLFLGATASIVIGGPLAYLVVGLFHPTGFDDQAWRGLAALSGSWIGGGANFVAVGKSAEASDAIMGLMVIVDVSVASVWMAVLLFFAGKERDMDARLGADRRALDELREKIERYQAETRRPATLPDLLSMVALAFGVTWAATALAGTGYLPEVKNLISAFTWVVILVTAVGVSLSFTRFRRLEGAGAGALGSTFLYLLVASIGAGGDLTRIPEVLDLFCVGALWMVFHAAVILLLRRFLRAPIFFAAVGSQANVGGAASAPIVASAFHPALAPVGVLLAVAGYALGIYAGLVCGWLLRAVHGFLY